MIIPALLMLASAALSKRSTSSAVGNERQLPNLVWSALQTDENTDAYHLTTVSSGQIELEKVQVQ